MFVCLCRHFTPALHSPAWFVALCVALLLLCSMSIQEEKPPLVEIMDDLDQPQEHLRTITKSEARPLMGEKEDEPKDKCVCVYTCVHSYMCAGGCVYVERDTSYVHMYFIRMFCCEGFVRTYLHMPSTPLIVHTYVWV